MKAINIQRRRLMTSLALSALAAAPGASWAQTAAKALAPARGARIVVVGAGVGGATAAKYLKLFNKNLDVTLIDRNPNFIRHYGSSELITGAVTMEDLTVSYDALSDRYGVRVVRDTIVGLDADRRTVIGEKGRYAYDKLIVSPGIELLYEGIPGYSAELAATKIPSGWIAGPQTQLLADQLKAMPQGGTFCLVAPPNPYRCPPGPYERAALVTEWCAKHNPTAKIIVTDPKNNFVTDETMLLGWNRLYGFSIPADYKARLDKYASPAPPRVGAGKAGRAPARHRCERHDRDDGGGRHQGRRHQRHPADARRQRCARDGPCRQDGLLPDRPPYVREHDHS